MKDLQKTQLPKEKFIKVHKRKLHKSFTHSKVHKSVLQIEKYLFNVNKKNT